MYFHRYHYSTLFFCPNKSEKLKVCMDYVAYCSKHDRGRIARLVAIHRLVSAKCLAPKIWSLPNFMSALFTRALAGAKTEAQCAWVGADTKTDTKRVKEGIVGQCTVWVAFCFLHIRCVFNKLHVGLLGKMYRFYTRNVLFWDKARFVRSDNNQTND